jgi:hypothetical protein
MPAPLDLVLAALALAALALPLAPVDVRGELAESDERLGDAILSALV